jgi:hypothetical protein
MSWLPRGDRSVPRGQNLKLELRLDSAINTELYGVMMVASVKNCVQDSDKRKAHFNE